MSEWLDYDGYPTEEALERIRKWDHKEGFGAWLDFIHDIWWAGEMLWTEKVRGNRRVCDISTGGWSGNEDIIGAMHGNFIGWHEVFRVHKRGGHYVLELKP